MGDSTGDPASPAELTASGVPGARVALVDDDPWVRAGREAVLVAAGHQVVMSTDHGGALAAPETFDGIDVAFVDARDPAAGFDRYRGVSVVQAIRDRHPSSPPVVVVITGHALDDVLRLRMADAGADALYAHEDIRTHEDLVGLVDDPLGGPVAPPASPGALAELGLGADAHPNDAMRYIHDAGLEPSFDSAASGESQKALPAGRRRLLSARARLTNLLDASPQDTRASTADWRSLVRIVDRLRGDDTDRSTDR